MKKLITLVALASLSGCSMLALKDIAGIAPSEAELAKMPATQVCQALGAAYVRNQPQAFMSAKSEAFARISKNEIQAHNCEAIAQMKGNSVIQSGIEARAAANAAGNAVSQSMQSMQTIQPLPSPPRDIVCRATAGGSVRCRQ